MESIIGDVTVTSLTNFSDVRGAKYPKYSKMWNRRNSLSVLI